MSDKIQEIMNMPEFDLKNFSVIGKLLLSIAYFYKQCS